MAAFAPLKLGGWAYGEILTSAQMNQLNTDFPFALNLRDGGSYTPSGNVGIQTPTTKTIVLNGCTFDSAADGSALHCSIDIVVAGGANITGSVSCGAVFASTLQATTSITSTADTILGSIAATHSVTINASTTAYNRVRSPKRLVQGGDAGVIYQYSPASYDLIYIPDGHAVAASTRWRISSGYVPITASQCGEIISFRHLGTGSAVDIQNQAGTTIATIGPFGSGNLIRVDVAYNPLIPGYVLVDLGYVG